MIPNLQAPLLTIYVTNRCNLSCMYCMRNGTCGNQSTDHEIDAASLKNIMAVAKEEGYVRVKFSSEWGEPLLRSDIEELIEHANKLAFTDISMSTNGTLLRDRVATLHKAGLHRLCVSLDTLKPTVYKKIVGQDAFDDVIAGIEEAVSIFGAKIKVNMVVINNVNTSEIKQMLSWTGQKGIILQMIEVVGKDQIEAGLFCDLDPVVELLSNKASLVSVDKLEKVTTIIGTNFRAQARQSRKWPKMFYRNERMVLHPDGEIGFWLYQHTKHYAISNARPNKTAILSQLKKTKSLAMNPSETRTLAKYGNRKMVS
jgi:molybdenum cofactor biosynthesis enzyme MoaA